MSSSHTRRSSRPLSSARLTLLAGALALLPASAAAIPQVVSAAAIAPSPAVTDTFTGTATTGVGQPLPVDINPSDVVVRSSDGAIGLGYTYAADGKASGRLPGRFVYSEHGYLFFTNPADPTTYAGSSFTSGTFTLTPANGGAPVVITDTDPAAYTHGVATVPVADAGKLLGQVARLRSFRRDLQPKKGVLTYGYFTFTDAFGTFTGIATPDFRKFTIEITFAAPAQPARPEGAES